MLDRHAAVGIHPVQALISADERPLLQVRFHHREAGPREHGVDIPGLLVPHEGTVELLDIVEDRLVLRVLIEEEPRERRGGPIARQPHVP